MWFYYSYLKNTSGTSEHLERLDISKNHIARSTTCTVVRTKIHTQNNGCHSKNVVCSWPVGHRNSSFSPSSAPHPLMHWTHGVVSLLLSLLKVVSRLQRVTSRRHFFFKSPFPRRMVLYLYCIIRQQPLPIQNVQMLQVSFTRLGVGGQLRAAFSYYLHGPSLKAAKSRVGASSWQTWPDTPFSAVEPTPTVHGRQPLYPPSSRAPLTFQDRWAFIGSCTDGVRSRPTGPERPYQDPDLRCSVA
jgi:hypothetical protein